MSLNNNQQSKSRIVLFYILEFSWGLPLTLIGLLVSLILIILGKKPKKFGPSYCFPIANGYGLELFFGSIVSTNDSYDMKCHELGHAIQNAYFGIFTLFLTFIPSASRYWMYKIKNNKHREMFAYIILIISEIVASIFIILAYIYDSIIILFAGIIIMIYFFILCGWLIFIEIPKFKYKTPLYDDVWFEYTASKWGKEFMQKYYSNIKGV